MGIGHPFNGNRKKTMAIKIEIALTDEILGAIADKILEKQGSPQAPKNELDQLYTSKEVAKMLGSTQQTINKHIKRGLLLAKKTGKNYTITHQNLLNYVNKK